MELDKQNKIIDPIKINKEISELNKDILTLNLKKRAIKIPTRNLLYQNRYLKYGNRNIENEIRIKKMKRLRYKNEIYRKRKRINFLQSMLN